MLKPNPKNAAFLANDITKRRNECLLEVPETGHRRCMSVLNAKVIHDRLAEALHALKRPMIENGKS